MQTAQPDVHVNAELFGGLRVALADGSPVKFRTRKTASLFAYLAFFSDGEQPRDVLVDMFWPDANYDSGRQSLRMALSALRSALEDSGAGPGSVVETDRSSVRIRSVRTDVAEFQDLAATSDASKLARALRLVRGPLMSGFDDSWIVAQWLRLEESYAQAAVRLMEMSSDEQARKAALILGKEAVALLGPREDVHVALINLYVADGQPGEALAQFEELERLTDEQWGEPPTDAAYQVFESIPRGVGRRAVRERPSTNRVPARTNAFIGRETEIAELTEIVSGGRNRLITICGPGGCGKTALAMELVSGLASNERVPVWICELASLATSSRVVDAIVSSITGKADGKADLDHLVELVGPGSAVLVLDNLEHLLPGAALTVKSVLERLPNLKIVVTSRVLLGIQGEQAYPLKPLAVPDQNMKLTELRVVPSVELFVDRANAAKPEFRLSPENAAAVAEICRRVEGLPLALELAAARIVTHSPAQILARLVKSLDFLVSRKLDVEQRHRSLRATLDWSLEHLDEAARQVFATLGIFRGSFSLEAGQAVSQSESFDQCLELLVESSLVQSLAENEEARFRLLEPIRDYALDRLGPGDFSGARRRHFDYYSKFAEDDSAGFKAWLDKLNVEHENLLAAFQSTFDGVISTREAIEFLGTCRPFFRPRGHTNVWREEVNKLVLTLDDSTDILTRAKVQIEVARISANAVDGPTMMELFREAERLGSLAMDDDILAHAHLGLGGGHKLTGEYAKSIDHYEAAISAFERLGDDKLLATTTRQLAMAHVSMGDHDMTFETLKRALPYARKSGDAETLAWCLTDLGVEQAVHGFLEESENCFKEAHELCIATDNVHMRSIVYWQQAETELRTGRSHSAVQTIRLSVEGALAANFKEGLKWIMVVQGAALVADGQVELGVRTLGKILRWRSDEQRGLTGDELEIVEPAKSTGVAALGQQRFDEAWRSGESADLDELLEELLGRPR